MRFNLCRPSESNEGRRTIRFIKGDGPFVRRGGPDGRHPPASILLHFILYLARLMKNDRPIDSK